MEEIIIFNECFNADGKHIHLYRNGETNVWAAYGYSAYKVAAMECRDDISIIKSYSLKLLMPVVILGNEAHGHIATLCHKEEQTPDYIRLSVPETLPAGVNGYRDWAQGLRDAIA